MVTFQIPFWLIAAAVIALPLLFCARLFYLAHLKERARTISLTDASWTGHPDWRWFRTGVHGVTFQRSNDALTIKITNVTVAGFRDMAAFINGLNGPVLYLDNFTVWMNAIGADRALGILNLFGIAGEVVDMLAAQENRRQAHAATLATAETATPANFPVPVLHPGSRRNRNLEL